MLRFCIKMDIFLNVKVLDVEFQFIYSVFKNKVTLEFNGIRFLDGRRTLNGYLSKIFTNVCLIMNGFSVSYFPETQWGCFLSATQLI